MRKSILYALVAYATLAFAGGSPAFADATIDRTPPPAWVELIDPPEADPAAVKAAENGIAAHLSEYQVKQTPEGFDVFDRYVYTIVDRAGLDEGAAVEWTFDPTRHHVSVNHLRVIRDGKVLDQSDAKPDVYRRETDAERGIFDGRLTARFNLEDVRVGDTIDYARTVTVKQLTERGLMSRSFSTEWTQPIGLVRQRVIWSEPLTIRKVGTDVEPEITRSGADTVYEWRIANPKPKRAEEYVPAGYPSTGWVELSNAADWGPIVDRLVDVYRTDSPLPPSYEQQVSDLTALVLTPQERMIAAIRLVQDEIRYVSLSIGAGSYEPRKPVEVVRSGFGDCKDKALLLATLLNRLGVKAQVALTDTSAGPSLNETLPALSAFDHAIVKAEIDGRIYWIDATNYLQGGAADNFVQADFSYALPIEPGRKKLEAINARPSGIPETTIVETFDFPTEAGAPLKLAVQSTHRGIGADNMRRSLASKSRERIGNSYLEYYASNYPGIESVGHIAVSDDRNANVVMTFENYELSSEALEADDLHSNFPLRADLEMSNLPTPTSVGRRSPIALPRPVHRVHQTIVNNLKARFQGPTIDHKLTPYFWFDIASQSTENTFFMTWSYIRMPIDRVPVEAISKYKKFVKAAVDNTALFYDFTYVDKDKTAKVPDPHGQ